MVTCLTTDQLPRDATIGVYGAGGRAAMLLDLLERERPDLDPVVFDTYRTGTFKGRSIHGPSELDNGLRPDCMVVASVHWFEICADLAERGCRDLILPIMDGLGRQMVDAVFDEAETFCQIRIHKNACRSIAKVLTRDFRAPDVHVEVVYNADPRFASAFKFAFVRHPLDRMVSCYFEKYCAQTANQDDSMRLRLPTEKMFGLPEIGFEDFVTKVAALDDLYVDRHCAPQHTFIYQDQTCLVDFVGRFEHLRRDMDGICRRLGIENTMPHVGKSQRPRDYMAMFDDRLLEIAVNRYRRDFELFGYELP